ncbi:MAG: tetratricopeptide repeat protein [Bryobacteraceae bacterium]|nr:tetratricopeptide repeat protein [Bryobacteraceae bacterium]
MRHLCLFALVLFTGFPAAAAQLETVRGANGREITTQSVSIHPNAGPLTIHVPEAPGGAPVPGNGESSVSLHRLSHNVPKAAKKEFEKAVRAGDDHQTVIGHLLKAVEIDPNYVEALNNLGSRYIQTDRSDDALAVLTKAQEIDPASARVQTNLAVVLLSKQKVADAERAARRAFQLASDDPKARYILALALYKKEQYTDETVGLLRASLDHFPAANIALAWVYANQGKKTEARGLLNGYLSAGHTERAPQVRRMLTMLQQ